jgi:hypothetical protein
MDILSQPEVQALVNSSTLAAKYNEVIDRESAFEILEERLKANAEKGSGSPGPAPRQKTKETSTIEEISKNTMVRQVGRTVFRELARGLLGVLGVKSTTRRRR